ncbi:CHAT domain-containing protein [Calothrix sp. UHCC 0171]|uniref:CHAT domain-containing protein n=1 Tax=Calothrix sp. UHCC 0171 TaxID=3110245 RepID=UPI002B218EA6|nr:CHAT domain-containing protein [Calothrix sp. UHCC 0171]MEA5572569.1 CHAT domain-containing protein [Calothrix sp. UHCC 0171]
MKKSPTKFKKYHKILLRFFMPMAIAALLSITSPIFAQIIANNPPTPSIVQSQSGISLDKQAQALYQQGDFSTAAKLFQEAAQAHKSTNPIRQALSLSNLSLCFQELGQWDTANSTINEAIALLAANKKLNPEQLSVLAKALDIQGSLQLAQGKADIALKTWERVGKIYTQLNQPNRLLASQINQVKALQHLGLHRRGIELLAKGLKLPPLLTTETEKLKLSLSMVAASPESATALRTLGESLRTIGNLPSAKLLLERSLAIAQELKLPETTALVQISLGNTARAQLNFDKNFGNRIGDAEKTAANLQTAINFYQQAAKNASGTPKIQAQLNLLSLLAENNQQDAAKNLLPQVQQEIEALPSNQAAIDARVNLAQTMIQMQGAQANTPISAKGENIAQPAPISELEAAKLLATAIKDAKKLGNPRTESYALGTLGNIDERQGRWADAQKLTEQALQLAQQINASDISYIWQWQLGRVAKAQGNNDRAITYYQEAIATIKSLRSDLAAANPDIQFSFRNAVEPIHRELVELLVESNQEKNWKVARNVIEGLQLVELDNFFREACLTAKPEQIDQVDAKAAVIYPIILQDKLAIVASLPKVTQDSPNQKLNKLNKQQSKNTTPETRDFRYYKTDISKQEVEQLASRLRENLGQATAFDVTLPQLQKMYDLVIRPEAADLAATKVETLVFVLDGVLRNIPMSALHDGEQFLVEKYSVALTPGLQLLTPRSLKQGRLGALVGGIDAARPGFTALPYVGEEVKKIQSEVPSRVLFNEKFTNPQFQNRISTASSPIIHLATHGQFSSNADETFIITWDGKIKVNQLSSLLKTVELSGNNTLELLVLSACETATGDARSALGLAGVAVRSGARSTVATLWRVNDKASAILMSQFYDQIAKANTTGVSKAEALRRAQVAILKNPDSDYTSPYYWAAYVLLGNWI